MVQSQPKSQEVQQPTLLNQQVVIKDIRVSEAIWNENPAQILINPPKLPVLKF